MFPAGKAALGFVPYSKGTITSAPAYSITDLACISPVVLFLENLMALDPNSPEVVANELSEPEAASLAEFLRGRGIHSHVIGAHVSRLYGSFVPGESVQIWVKRSDAAAARLAIEDFHSKHRDVPPIVRTHDSIGEGTET